MNVTLTSSRTFCGLIRASKARKPTCDSRLTKTQMRTSAKFKADMTLVSIRLMCRKPSPQVHLTARTKC